MMTDSSGSKSVHTLRHFGRRIASFTPYLGIVPPPALRPMGISAMTMAKNEEDWVASSLNSILNSVDEILVADHGSEDSTPRILARLAHEHPERIRLINVGDRDFPSAINLMMSQTRYRWILRWHADFIARTSGPSSISHLVKRTRSMSAFRHFCIALSGFALDGDLEHQFPDRRDRPEPFLYTYSPRLEYRVRERWESLHVPWYYEKQTWTDAYYFHMRSVKSAARMLQKLYWSRWFDARNKGSSVPMRDYIREKATAEFGTASLEEAAAKFVLDEFQGAIPYSRDVCGDYPEALVPLLQNPPFRLIFNNGKLVGRTEKQHDLSRQRGRGE